MTRTHEKMGERERNASAKKRGEREVGTMRSGERRSVEQVENVVVDPDSQRVQHQKRQRKAQSVLSGQESG